jgi:hypothetical protein
MRPTLHPFRLRSSSSEFTNVSDDLGVPTARSSSGLVRSSSSCNAVSAECLPILDNTYHLAIHLTGVPKQTRMGRNHGK